MKMSDTTENNKYKWTPESTTLLVSVWTDRQVQKQLEYAVKPQLIWESIAKYMRKKGYEVTARQCRSRMKQVLVCYREAKKAGTRAGVERYYESIDKVLENKRSSKGETEAGVQADADDGGVDTVDSGQINVLSPEKETKTQANFLMRRNKFEEPPEPIIRHVNICHGPWQYGHQEYYGDSSESNETVLVRPHRSLSPLRDTRFNTESKILRASMGKGSRRSLPEDRYRFNLESNRFADIPLKNAVQNVQNQIIQENMLLRNQLSQEYVGNQTGSMQQPPIDYCINVGNMPQRNSLHDNMVYQQPSRVSTNLARIQSQLQHCALTECMDIPQQSKNFIPYSGKSTESAGNYKQSFGTQTTTYHSDVAPNLNDAFCQTTKISKAHNLNETYDQDTDMFPVNATTITNNATFNDDTLSIDFIQDSPSPSENGVIGSKNDSPTLPPNVPFRKKKAQKLEQLMLNAITSQTEVVNKILAAQDSMVSRILDRDQDRQNRLENRLDQLMNVVHATVLNKSTSSSKESADNGPVAPVVSSVPLCFSPPPKPGTAPPKLDLVPPKPCRVPCTSPSANIELVNQNPIQTKPGVIRPPKPGTIWSKLGPVSQSPFVKAQKQMSAAAGEIQSTVSNEWKTKSSAERRIAYNSDSIIEGKAAIWETEKFLQSEKLIEERIENARQIFFDHPSKKIDTQPARRKLFNQPQEDKKPSAAVILTSTFLEVERQAEEKSRYIPIYKYKSKMCNEDELLNGQGEGFDQLRSLGHTLGLNTSTPAKVETKAKGKEINIRDYESNPVPKQTIQQLAQLVMQSARWKNAATELHPTSSVLVPPRPPSPPQPPPRMLHENYAQQQSYNKARDWLQDPYSYGTERPNYEDLKMNKNLPMGFINPNLNHRENEDVNPEVRDRYQTIGFDPQILPANRYSCDLEFLKKERGQYHRYRQLQKPNYVTNKHRDLIDKYVHDAVPEKQTGMQNRIADSDADDNDEYLDTTTTIKPYRKTSLTSNGTSGTGNTLKNTGTCAIS